MLRRGDWCIGVGGLLSEWSADVSFPQLLRCEAGPERLLGPHSHGSLAEVKSVPLPHRLALIFKSKALLGFPVQSPNCVVAIVP